MEVRYGFLKIDILSDFPKGGAATHHHMSIPNNTLKLSITQINMTLVGGLHRIFPKQGIE